MSIKIKKTRCPKGTRRNNKTGECEEIKHNQEALSIKEISQIKSVSYKQPNNTPITSFDNLSKNPPKYVEYNPCNEEVKLREERKRLNNDLKKAHSDCEITKYKIIYKYFNEDERHSKYKDLLNALMHYYKDEKSKDINFILPFQKFIDMFEMDTMKLKNFKKQHVFEALCKILLMYDYDQGELGRNKEFYGSLESFIKNPANQSNIKDRNEIINEHINVSSEGGVVDIFFKTNTTSDDKQHCEWACDCIDTKTSKDYMTSGQEYILIQNKYYSKEKSDIKNYDVTKIYAKAQSLYNARENITPRIVLMVNNSQALSDKLVRSRDASKSLIANIYGVYEIDKWFNLLLYDLYNSRDINDFLEKKGSKDKTRPELSSRFHQMYFTDATLEYYKEGYKKFIWGAVPRSGKSYMIGDLISKRRNTNNDVILILGAKTETESQFVKMFCEYSDYADYGIIKASKDKAEPIKNCPNLDHIKSKNIYLFSQEWFKDKIEIENLKAIFTKKGFESLFTRGNQVDIYFDEIHKGGSTDKSENILNAIHNSGVKIDIFIMVTATFAKPNIKYKTNFIDTKEPKILEWSYEDQQVMKNIKNETKMDMMINSRVGIEREIIKKIFEKYNFIYGVEFLDIISKQYARHPELVLVQPYDKIKGVENFEMNQVFASNLNCEACAENQTIENLRNPNRIFFDYGRVQKLIQLIVGNLHPVNSIYGYLKTIGAPDYSNLHSELWFLPDDNLYVNPDMCRNTCKKTASEKTHDENNSDNRSLPNIEPVTRGLAFALMDTPFFRDHYNVLIVHNANVSFKDDSGRKISYTDIFKDTGIDTTSGNKESLSTKIKDYESKSYKEGKNVIILTGAKLRLGISLPCVDIGFNFDSIQSVDLNYQTMFRVLTERYNKPKTHGYYVDFNKDRFIKFLYEYSNTYSSAKNITSIKENLTYLQGLLLLFNMNGIGLGKLDEKQELKLYNILINELKLNEDGYKKYYSKFDNVINLFKKSLINISTIDLHEIKELVSTHKLNVSKKTEHILKKGKKSERPVHVVGEEDEIDEDDVDEDIVDDITNDDDDLSNSALINIISDILPRIIALLALFSNKDNYDCEKLEDCLNNSIRNIREFTTCSCENISDSDALSCYFNSPFYTKKLLLLLQSIQKLLRNPNYTFLHDSINFIFNNIKDMGKENKSLITSMTPEEIQNTIEKYLPVRDDKKHKNGEVFTPVSLIKEMLDKLPSNVWTNPNLKWLDPANGIGNFPMVVYQKLLEKLPDKYSGENGSYSNEKEKKMHIIKNMLYMVELDSSNIKISRRIFGKDANISCANFLEQEAKWKRDFNGVDKFDIIIGNPPFQNERVGDTPQGGNDLYPIFFVKSFNLLNNDGYLSFINPAKWRAPDKKGDLKNMWDLFVSNNPIFLRIYGGKETLDLFNGAAATRIDYYVLQKNTKNKGLTIVDEKNQESMVDLTKWNFLPNYNYENIKRILTTEDNGVKVIYSSSQYDKRKPYMQDKPPNAKYPYPVRHSYTMKDGPIIYSSKTKEPTGNSFVQMFGVPKVILGKGGHPYPYNDYKGEYGMSNYSFAIPIKSKKEGDDIIKAINTDEFNNIIEATKWNSGFTDHNMFKYFRPDFYKHFSNKDKAGTKIKQFLTRKHRERKLKTNGTKSVSKGGKRRTKKMEHNKKTRRMKF